MVTMGMGQHDLLDRPALFRGGGNHLVGNPIGRVDQDGLAGGVVRHEVAVGLELTANESAKFNPHD